jgi:hypothetical protein
MSKFADKLQRVYKGTAPALGFRRSGEEKMPQILAVANLGCASASISKAVVDADAVVISSQGMDAESFRRSHEALGDIPLGLLLEGIEHDAAAMLVNLGCDFVVFDVKTPLEVVNKEGMGRILRIESALDLGLVRAINLLPLAVDGVLLTGEYSPVTIERLLICQRFSDILDKPLLVTLGLSVNSDELSSLCQAGVKAVVLAEGLTAKDLAEVKKGIASLPRQAKRKTRSTPILPQISQSIAPAEEEDDDV